MKVDFVELFLFIKLPSLSIQLLNDVVSKEPLVRVNNDCLNALTGGIIAKFQVDHPKVSQILCVSGYGKHLVFEV